MIYVNSTLPVRRSFSRDGSISPLHYWGWPPRKGDIVLANRSTRVQIVLRAKLGGLDLPVLARTLYHLFRGERQIYLVTQPDLIHAVRFLKWLFPDLRVVTWVWTRAEVERWARGLASCQHVFALTPSAAEALAGRFGEGKGSLQLWGANPDEYGAGTREPEYDLGLFGLTKRDARTLAAALRRQPRTLLMTKRTSQQLGEHRALLDSARGGEEWPEPETGREMLETLRRVRVVVVPLFAKEDEPAGYTNLLEALLSGRALVITHHSLLPVEVLALPGVVTYEAENATSLSEAIERALTLHGAPGAPEWIAAAAAAVLNGAALEEAIRKQFSLPRPAGEIEVQAVRARAEGG